MMQANNSNNKPQTKASLHQEMNNTDRVIRTMIRDLKGDRRQDDKTQPDLSDDELEYDFFNDYNAQYSKKLEDVELKEKSALETSSTTSKEYVDEHLRENVELVHQTTLWNNVLYYVLCKCFTQTRSLAD